MFGKNKIKAITLADYKNIWSKFCFLDESGSLCDGSNPFFTIGIIKCSQPYYLYSKLQYQRTKVGFYDEMKFNKTSANNIDFFKFAIDTFLETRSLNFYSYTVDKLGNYFRTHFNSDQWKAYEEISIQLLKDGVLGGDVNGDDNEIVILIADHITTPKSVKYEVVVKNKINKQKARLAIAGVCRFDSKGNDLLQVVDLIIGAINYDLKLKFKLVKGDKNKILLVKYIKDQLGVQDFVDGYRDRKFNIFVDRDIKRRSPV